MERFLFEKLVKWADSEGRKPLVLNGARQVGKTWLLKEFGKRHYENCVFVSFDRDERARNLFKGSFDVRRIISNLQTIGETVIKPGKTLVAFDEIQLCPEALTALKYWQEEAPEYHVAAAGSLMGLALMEGTGYPVGKVHHENLYPMSFGEFLWATENRGLWNGIVSGDIGLLNACAGEIEELLKQYYVVGGMPEAVLAYCKNLYLEEARECQMDLLEAVERDFSKHFPLGMHDALMGIWKGLPVQLAKVDKRFKASEIALVEGRRSVARDFRGAFEWLEAARLAFRVFNVVKPGLPLAGYRNHVYKVYGLDVGLLGAQARLSPKAVIDGNAVFTEYKGGLTEQYVQQELRAKGYELYTWIQADSKAELDFIVEDKEGRVIPVEAKAERNLKAKSLKVYREKYCPDVAIRTSLAEGNYGDGLMDLPLGAIGEFERYIRIGG